MSTSVSPKALIVAFLSFLAVASPVLAQPANDNCANATAISGTGLFPFDLTTATTGTEGQTNPNCAFGGPPAITNDVWFCWTPPCSGLAFVNTCGLTNVDTKIAFYVGCACPPGQALCCNDDSCGVQSSFSCEVQCGQTYLIQIGTKPGTPGGPGQLNLACEGTPCAPTCDTCCGKRPNFITAAGFNSSVAAITQQSGVGMRVVDFINMGAPQLPAGTGTAGANTNWYAPFYTPTVTQDWKQTTLGTVFGLTIDDLGNVFVAHTSVYGDFIFGPGDALGVGGPGAIYKIDTNTGASSVFATLPNNMITGCSGSECWPGLGNLCFSCTYQNIYVSNHEDGRIYRLNTAGAILSTWKHSTGLSAAYSGPDPLDGNGFSPLTPHAGTGRGQRVWAVRTNDNRLYYSVWREDGGRPSTTTANEIWSVRLTASGDFIAGTEQLEITMPVYTNGFSNPVSDISFKPGSCCILLAERTMQNDTTSNAHASRLLEYCRNAAGNWQPSASVFATGSFVNAPQSCAGGCDYDFNTSGGINVNVWATSDAMKVPADTPATDPWIYGIGGMSFAGGNPYTNGLMIDSDQNTATHDKFLQGDVEITCPAAAPCSVNSTGTACTGGCTTPGLQCVPVEVTRDITGHYRISRCDCPTSPNQCHIDLDPATGLPICVNTCPTPPGDPCTLKAVAHVDGTITYTCECQSQSMTCMPVHQCNPNMPGTCEDVCTGDCPRGTICLPKKITISPDGSPPHVTECDCVQNDPILCRPALIAPNTVGCIGECPEGQPCEQFIIQNADGSVDFRCCCVAAVGACCLPQGQPPVLVCVSTHECDCLRRGGTWHGIGSTCTPNPCNGASELGACCVQGPAGSFCTITTAGNCTQPNIWMGVGTTCSPIDPCDPASSHGACCLYTATLGSYCQILSQPSCLYMGGTYQGNNTTCTPTNPCPPIDPVGACCARDDAGNQACVIVSQAKCQQINGIYYGNGSTCNPPPPPPSCVDQPTCQCQSACHSRAPTYTAAAYSTFTGQVAVATQYSPPGSTQPVVLTFDVKNRATAPLNTDWTAATLYAHASWVNSSAGLGSVFGVTLDKRGHIYATATTCYTGDDLGLAGTFGAIYKLNNTTGAISVFAILPNTGPGLGNIDYDGARDQFFVTNHEDGRIYRIDPSGTILSTFDHATGTIAAGGAPEPGDPPGFVPLGERLWGVGTYQNRVYYAVWSCDQGRPSATASNSIWSIALSGSGNFTGVAQHEFDLPISPQSTHFGRHSNPVSDISFSRTACMLLSERTMDNDTTPGAHNARVLEYRKILGAWYPSGSTFQLGQPTGPNAPMNSAGGSDYDADSRVYATGDYLQTSPQVIYGFQSLPCTGGTVTNSVLRDFNGIYQYFDKTEIGDIEIACPDQCVKPPTGMVLWFPFDETTGTFADNVVGNPNGTYVNSPLSVPGMVNAARNFNGATNYVTAPNLGIINFGVGDFSFDAWIRTAQAGGVATILDKRQAIGASVFGYRALVSNGQFAFQLADGTSSGFGPGAFVADNQWHHVAATIVRNSTTGMKLYVDGVAATFDPTPRSGTLSNFGALTVATSSAGFTVQNFRGEIDEVELFNRALTAAEVQSLYNARRAGKCRDNALAGNYTYCINQSSAVVPQVICNYSTATQSYNWSLAGPVAGTGCTLFSPMSFTPSSGSVTVGPGSCAPIPPINVTIPRPAGLVPGQTECYQLSVLNTGSGNALSSVGKLGAINQKCFTHGGVVIGVPLPIGDPIKLGFIATNTSSTIMTVPYDIRPVAQDGSTPQTLRLNGLPPGEPVIGTLTLAPGDSAPIPVDVTAVLHEAFELYTILLEADVDGDGVPDPVDGIIVRTYAGCGARAPGDVTGDGVVDASDIPAFVSMVLNPVMDPAQPDAWCASDINLDAQVDGEDVAGMVQLQIVP